MKRMVLASGNAGKLAELRSMLADLDTEFIAQSDLDIGDVEETGMSFVENAILKARHAARASNLPAVADDSGLVVDALRGAPGIYSARYAGAGASDAENLEKLLDDMEDVPNGQRGAAFHCVIVYMSHAADPSPVICEGVWRGQVLREPRGSRGFGYDPVFLVPGLACASAELDPETKNAISHRGQAIRQLKARLARR